MLARRNNTAYGGYICGIASNSNAVIAILLNAAGDSQRNKLA
jgi:hypothetical protein